MQLFTFTQLKQKLGNDYDITDEVFVNDTELVGYINEALDDAETAIHTMHWEDKYFLVPGTLSIVNGTQDYSLPSDIYANKIRQIYYINGQIKYEIKRIRDISQTNFVDVTDQFLRYLLINTTASGVKLRVYPTPTETINVPIWYVRNMLRMDTSALTTNICELPECVNFVYQHVKKNLAKKSRRTDLIQLEDADLKIQYQIMLDALKDMVVDENNLIPCDLSSYYDQSGEGWGW